MSVFARLRQRIARRPGLDRAFRGFVQFMRQWPWVCPRGVIRSAARWVQGTRYLPLRRMYGASLNCEQTDWYFRQRGDWYEGMYPETIHRFAPPADVGEQRAPFRDDLVHIVPSAGVCGLRGAYVFSDQGAVLSRDNRLFGEYTHHFHTRPVTRGEYFRPFRTFAWDVPRRSEWISLLAAPEGRNHYHWTFDVLPRLHLLEPWRKLIELYALPDGLSQAQRDSLAVLGIDESQILTLEPNRKIFCERLIVPSLPGSEGSVPRWSIDFLRSQFCQGSPPPRDRKLYLERGDVPTGRRLVNEAELMTSLRDRGFEIVDPAKLSFAEQVATFRAASVVVSLHGAGLTNLVYSDECRVLEIFSPDYFRPDCYFTLAQQMGHDYAFAVGQRSGNWGDVTVDVPAIVERLSAWSV